MADLAREVNAESDDSRRNWFHIYFVFLQPILSNVELHDFALMCNFQPVRDENVDA